LPTSHWGGAFNATRAVLRPSPESAWISRIGIVKLVQDWQGMKNAEALFREHQLVSFIENGMLTVRNRAGKEVMTKSKKFIPLGHIGHNGAARVVSDEAGEVKMGENLYAIRVRAIYWRFT
jgi:hypothetical protein